MGKPSTSNRKAEFSDFLERYLAADRATRVKAKAKADVLQAAEKAGYSKAAIKRVAELEKMEPGEREAQLRTYILYAHYAGHTDQLDMFSGVDFAALAVEDETDGDGSEEAQTKDIEDAVREAEDEVEAESNVTPLPATKARKPRKPRAPKS